MTTVETKIAKNGATLYYVDSKRVSRENAIEAAAVNREGNPFTINYLGEKTITVDKLNIKLQQEAHRYDILFCIMVDTYTRIAFTSGYKTDDAKIKAAKASAQKTFDAIVTAYVNGEYGVKIGGGNVEILAAPTVEEPAIVEEDATIAEKATVEVKDELPSGYITVNSGAEAWAIVGKHFPKSNLEFYRAGKGFNNEDTFCYTLDEIIYVHVTCTPDNSRVECIEVVNTNESGSARRVLTVNIAPPAKAEETAIENEPVIVETANAEETTTVEETAPAKVDIETLNRQAQLYAMSGKVFGAISEALTPPVDCDDDTADQYESAYQTLKAAREHFSASRREFDKTNRDRIGQLKQLRKDAVNDRLHKVSAQVKAMFDAVIEDDRDVFSLLPKREDLNDVDGEFDEDAAEYTDRNDRYNRGEKIAADLTAKLRTVDPTVEVTFAIDDDEDTYYLSYDGIIRTPFTATGVEPSFHAMKQSEAKPADADYMQSIEIVKLYRIKEAAKNALAETAAMYKDALELGDTEIFAKLGNERKEHHKAIIACTKRLRELGAIPEPKAPTPVLEFDDDDELIDPPEVKATVDEFTAKLAAFDTEITPAQVEALVYYTLTDSPGDKTNWTMYKAFDTTVAAAEWILSFVKTRVFECTVRDAEIIDLRNGRDRYALTDADITAINAVNTEPELPTPKPDSPFAIARGLDDVFRKTFHKVDAPYLDVITQDGAKIATTFGAAYISVDWRATDGYVFGNHFNDVLARYETPEQVTDVMTALRDAIKAGKTEFTFPTVEALTPEEPAPVVEETDREKFLKAKEQIKAAPDKLLDNGNFTTKWLVRDEYGNRNRTNKGNAANILNTFGLDIFTYLDEQEKWVAESISRSCINADAENFARTIVAPAKFLALPAPTVKTEPVKYVATQITYPNGHEGEPTREVSATFDTLDDAARFIANDNPFVETETGCRKFAYDDGYFGGVYWAGYRIETTDGKILCEVNGFEIKGDEFIDDLVYTYYKSAGKDDDNDNTPPDSAPETVAAEIARGSRH